MRWRAITAAVLALWATAAPAQPPDDEPIHDPNVEPAQFLQRSPAADAPVTPGAPGVNTPGSPRPVADPPPPVVRIQVRVPADAAPGEPIKYLLTVRNESRADAHQVTVRNPVRDWVEKVEKADPPFDKESDPLKQLVWSFGTLKPGESKSIELLLKPKPTATEVKNLAYVRFEHGEAVTTKVSRPGVKVTKLAPKEAVKDEPFAVRVVVENTGRVPAEKVRVVETADRAAKVEAVTTGGRPTPDKDATQYEWDLGTLAPGQRRVVEYRLTPGPGAAAATTTVVSALNKVQEEAKASTAVLVPGLGVKLTGPDAKAAVAPGEEAAYEITVRNTGTLPARDVRVGATFPADCRLTKHTERGQRTAGGVGWAVPLLPPGEAQSFRFRLRSEKSGHRTVTATATAARGLRDTQSLPTVFQGTAALTWEKKLDPPDALAVGRNGTLAVRVRNSGGEGAKNVRLTVELPDEVSFVESTPKLRPPLTKLEFPPETVPAGGVADYLVTYKAEKPEPAQFILQLTADALGDKPLQSLSTVTITGRGK